MFIYLVLILLFCCFWPLFIIIPHVYCRLMLFSGFFRLNKLLNMESISVYYPDANMRFEAYLLKTVGRKAIILLQDRICTSDLINGVWTISSASNIVLDLCDII